MNCKRSRDRSLPHTHTHASQKIHCLLVSFFFSIECFDLITQANSCAPLMSEDNRISAHQCVNCLAATENLIYYFYTFFAVGEFSWISSTLGGKVRHCRRFKAMHDFSLVRVPWLDTLMAAYIYYASLSSQLRGRLLRPQNVMLKPSSIDLVLADAERRTCSYLLNAAHWIR